MWMWCNVMSLHYSHARIYTSIQPYMYVAHMYCIVISRDKQTHMCTFTTLHMQVMYAHMHKHTCTNAPLHTRLLLAPKRDVRDVSWCSLKPATCTHTQHTTHTLHVHNTHTTHTHIICNTHMHTRAHFSFTQPMLVILLRGSSVNGAPPAFAWCVYPPTLCDWTTFLPPSTPSGHTIAVTHFNENDL